MTRALPILAALLALGLSAPAALFTLPPPPVLTSRVGLAWEPSTSAEVPTDYTAEIK